MDQFLIWKPATSPASILYSLDTGMGSGDVAAAIEGADAEVGGVGAAALGCSAGNYPWRNEI